MKNTLKNKAKFFGQYQGQRVLKFKYFNGEVADRKDFVDGFSLKDVEDNPDWLLELKSLSHITNKDWTEIVEQATGLTVSDVVWEKKEEVIRADFDIPFKPYAGLFCDKAKVLFSKELHEASELTIYDLLRSRNYALPWMGISVEQQIEWGWVKLKEEEL